MDHSMAPPITPVATGNASTETPEIDNAKRKRQPRNSACQACATLKMKCVGSPIPGVCERCNRMGRECVPAQPKPRKRRTTNGTPSDTPKGVPLSELLDGHASPGASAKPTPRPAPTPAPPRLEPKTDTIKRSLLTRPDLSYNGSKSFMSLLAHGLGLDANSAAAYEMVRGIDHSFVQSSLAVFRQLAKHFPFIDVPAATDAVNMIANRPILTAAICTVTAGANPDAQDRLSRAFRHALSTKAIIEGERSVDLCTGLLVYLAWHHQYMSKQQIYQELHLLAGMAADLGLYSQPPTPDAVNLIGDLEQQRVFLGCYYICCGLSVTGFHKPSPIKWTDSLRHYAENLYRAGNLPSDQLLLATMELLHAIEDLEDALRINDTVKRETFAHYVELHTKATNQRLRQLKRDHPQVSSMPGFAAATIHFHHRLLRASDVPDQATLMQCAVAIKDYMDDVLARPPITLHQVAIVEWTNLLEILVLMARVSRPLPHTAGWEAGALASMLQPDTIIDALCAHMNSAPAGDPLAPRHEVLLQWFRRVCDSIKKRILHERSTDIGQLRKDESHYETLHELGRNSVQSHRQTPMGSDGRYNLVNDEYNHTAETRAVSNLGIFNSFDYFGNGVLDEGFWSGFLNA